ncbi:head completion/stabilization protein [Parasalinivibrio latis]|uniref:head completion/stabilization protein n=1 Tax=Parasalinivibrio latis TaxID=2952610 RepID=UPI0030E15E40
MSFGGRTNTEQNTEISGNGWPSLSTAEFRKMRRIPFVFDESSIATAVEIAADAVQKQLDGVDGTGLAGAKLALYKRAVYARAHADLLPEFATQDRRDAAENAAEDSPEQDERFRSQSLRDIAQIRGKSPNGVELI